MSKDLVNMNAVELQKATEIRARLLKMALDEVGTPADLDAKRLMAIEKRHRYLALIDTGFTESQALALCDKP